LPNLSSLIQKLKAAGEITRLRLLALLATGELSVKDLTKILDQSQPRISRHLKLLVDAGLVKRHAEGAWAYFGIANFGDDAALVRSLLERINLNDPQLCADRAQLDQLRENQRDQAAAYFKKVAESWDQLRQLHVPEAAVEAAITSLVGQREIDLLIDLGTGTGRMLELLSSRFQYAIGVDSSHEMISVARAKLVAAQVQNAQIRLGDIADLNEYANSADLVILHQVLHYFDDPGRTILAARQLLEPGGELLIVDFASHDLEFLRKEHAHRRLGMSGEQVEAWARIAHLEVTEFQEIPSENETGGLTVCLWMLKDAGGESTI